MRGAPWTAAAKLPLFNREREGGSCATAVQGAFGTVIFEAASGAGAMECRSEAAAFLPCKELDGTGC